MWKLTQESQTETLGVADKKCVKKKKILVLMHKKLHFWILKESCGGFLATPSDGTTKIKRHYLYPGFQAQAKGPDRRGPLPK